jgi:exodeoxyribonuclease VII small subunit
MSDSPTRSRRSPAASDPAASDPAASPRADAGESNGGDNGAGDTPTYEAAREELIEVVRTLEAGGTTLEESLALWERGERLAQVCQSWLDGARQRLDAVIEGSDADQR